MITHIYLRKHESAEKSENSTQATIEVHLVHLILLAVQPYLLYYSA